MIALRSNLLRSLALVLAGCVSNVQAPPTPPVPAVQAEPPAPAAPPAPAEVSAPAPVQAQELVSGPEPTPLDTVGSAPPTGAPTEYDQMVEVLRAYMVNLHGPMDMTAHSIHRIGDWTWLSGSPHHTGTRIAFADPVQALMHKVGDGWTLVKLMCGEDTDACHASWKRLATDYPQAPKAIFPTAAPPKQGRKAALTAQFGGTRFTQPIEDLKQLELAPGETFKIREVARDKSSSHHVVALLDREPLHTHDTHDLLVFVLEGEGEMLIGDETRSIGPGSVVYVPRKLVHSMHNTTKKPLIGYAVFTPPFDGKDRVLVPAR